MKRGWHITHTIATFLRYIQNDELLKETLLFDLMAPDHRQERGAQGTAGDKEACWTGRNVAVRLLHGQRARPCAAGLGRAAATGLPGSGRRGRRTGSPCPESTQPPLAALAADCFAVSALTPDVREGVFA